MAKSSSSALPLIAIGGLGIGAALYFASRAKASNAPPELPADTDVAPKPKALPAPKQTADDDGGGDAGGSSSSAPDAPTPMPAVPAAIQARDEAADALAAARKAADAEKKKAVQNAARRAAPAPKAVQGKDGGKVLVSQAPEFAAPDTHAEEAEDPDSMRVAPFVSMPAAKPSTPKGFDKAKAKKLAAPVAANLKSKKKAGYDRKQLAAFQTAAGLTGDGVYGPASVAALKYYGVASPPAAFTGGKVTTYTPPG